MPRPDEADFLQFALKGDSAAIDFCSIVFRASQVLDDLVDGDPVSGEQVVETFWDIMVGLPQNPFYRQHVDTLVPMLQVFLQDWEDANRLERMGEHEQNIGFVLRDTVGGIITHVAGLVAGRAWQRAIAVSVRQHIHEDDLEQYRKELGE